MTKINESLMNSEVLDYLKIDQTTPKRMGRCISLFLYLLKSVNETDTLEIKNGLRMISPNENWRQNFVSDCLNLTQQICDDKITFRETVSQNGMTHRIYFVRGNVDDLDISALKDKIFQELSLEQ